MTPPAAPASIPFIGAFESTYQPVHDRDVLETTQHTDRWREDLILLRSCHVRRLRYPLRWHRIEPEPGQFDWRHTDEVLGFTTFLLCGHLGVWPPHDRGLQGFVRLATNVMPAVNRASRTLNELLDDAEHVHVEACERHTWSTPEGEEFAGTTNDRRFLMPDLLVGQHVDPRRPFVRDILAAGGEELLLVEPGHVDVLGVDYYAHNQWHWSAPGQGTTVSPEPVPLSELIVEYSERATGSRASSARRTSAATPPTGRAG